MGYVYVVAALAAWTALPFIYRRAADAKANPLCMLAGMGLAAAALDLGAMAVIGADPLAAHRSQPMLGGLTGIVAVAGILTFVAAVARGELAITWTLLTLSFALAAACCMVYPGESPTPAGLAGLALAVAAVVLLGLDMHRRQGRPGSGGARRGWGLFMTLAFLANVLTLYLFRVAAHLAPGESPEQTLTFLACMHGTFGLAGAALALAIRRGGRVAAGLTCGAAGGAMFFFGGLGVMLALAGARLPGYLLYPIINGGSALLVTVLSVAFLRERPGWLGRAGIAAGLAALVLLGWAS